MMVGMLRAILAFLLAAFVVPAVVFADGSTTRPVKVAVLPFDVVGDAGHEWIGHAMQEGLATGLQNGSGISAVIVAGLVPGDESAAIEMGKSVNADVVIFGGVQLVEETLRARGRMVSVRTGEMLGVLQSDGTVRGLFTIEDLLSDRASRILTPVKRVEASGAAAATFEIVGPTVASAGPAYFDGDLKAVIGKPDRFGDDADRYYYHSYLTSGCNYSCGYGGYVGSCGACFGTAGCSGNGILCPIAAPTRGW
jgi:TolB-like protein